MQSLYRFSIEKYEELVRCGVFTNRDRLELIEGFLVEKMTQYPPHTVSAELCRVKLDRMLPPGWHLRIERPLRIPKPRKHAGARSGGHTRRDPRLRSDAIPSPADVALVVEVADSSLDDDRNLKAGVYGGGEVALYWIVNLVDEQVEVYSGPSGPSEPVGYRHCEVYRRGEEVSLVIAGTEVGRIQVAELLP